MNDTARNLLIALGVALLVVILIPLLFMTGMMTALSGGMGGMMDGGDAWVMGMLILLVLITGIAFIAIGAARRR